MRVLGLDPSLVGAAWTLIERVSSFRGRWISTGEIALDGRALAELLATLAPGLVVVEQPDWIGSPKLAPLGPHIVNTAWAGGGIHLAAAALGYRAEAVYARQGRLWLTNSVSPDDAEIAAALPRALDGIPARTNSHARDAAVAAWAGLRLPADWTRMRALAAEAKSAQAGAKAAGRKRMKAIAKLR